MAVETITINPWARYKKQGKTSKSIAVWPFHAAQKNYLRSEVVKDKNLFLTLLIA